MFVIGFNILSYSIRPQATTSIGYTKSYIKPSQSNCSQAIYRSWYLMGQIHYPSKSWVFKSSFSFKFRQHGDGDDRVDRDRRSFYDDRVDQGRWSSYNDRVDWARWSFYDDRVDQGRRSTYQPDHRLNIYHSHHNNIKFIIESNP